MAFGNNSKVPVKWNNPQQFLSPESMRHSSISPDLRNKLRGWKCALIQGALLPCNPMAEPKAAIVQTLHMRSRFDCVFRETLWAGSRVEDILIFGFAFYFRPLLSSYTPSPTLQALSICVFQWVVCLHFLICIHRKYCFLNSTPSFLRAFFWCGN